jgi:hypothetical protein
MPRLTDRDYLFLRTYLFEVWQTRRQAFSLTAPRDQYYLHRYFRLSDDMSQLEALAHRRIISGEQPSLPQCAGRALKELANPKPLRRSVGSKRIIVYPLLRPDPDLGRICQALLTIVRANERGP